MTATTTPLPRALGLSVAVAQLMLALSWTVYAAFLPALAAQAGLPPSAVPLLLMLDQLVFMVADYACGVASDRVLAVQARLGPWLVGATLLSAAAFVLLPVLAPQGSPTLLVALTLVWTLCSSVLRAPPLNLIGRHALRPAQPAGVALAMLGLGLAGALAPWLAAWLKGQDARLPFALASLGVCAAALALALAERQAQRSPRPAADLRPAPSAGLAVAASAWPRLVAAALLAALAFQLHTSLNAAPQYRRFVAAEALVVWLPVFWAGFNLALWPAMKLAPRLGDIRLAAGAALVAAAAALAGSIAPSLAWLATAQALAGAAWAAMLAGGFMTALALGHVGREGRCSGVLSSSLAGAALLRLALVASGGAATLQADGGGWSAGAAALLWLGAAGLLASVLRFRVPTARSSAGR